MLKDPFGGQKFFFFCVQLLAKRPKFWVNITLSVGWGRFDNNLIQRKHATVFLFFLQFCFFSSFLFNSFLCIILQVAMKQQNIISVSKNQLLKTTLLTTCDKKVFKVIHKLNHDFQLKCKPNNHQLKSYYFQTFQILLLLYETFHVNQKMKKKLTLRLGSFNVLKDQL